MPPRPDPLWPPHRPARPGPPSRIRRGALGIALLLAAFPGCGDDGPAPDPPSRGGGAGTSRPASFRTRSDAAGPAEIEAHIPAISAVRSGGTWRIFADPPRAAAGHRLRSLRLASEDGRFIHAEARPGSGGGAIEATLPGTAERLAAFAECEAHGLWRSDVLVLGP